MNDNQTFDSVFDAIADSAQEAENLKTRADLMIGIIKVIQGKGWKQAEAATKCGLTQPRVNDLLRGKINNFSIDALVNVASMLGLRVHVELIAA